MGRTPHRMAKRVLESRTLSSGFTLFRNTPLSSSQKRSMTASLMLSDASPQPPRLFPSCSEIDSALLRPCTTAHAE